MTVELLCLGRHDTACVANVAAASHIERSDVAIGGVLQIDKGLNEAKCSYG